MPLSKKTYILVHGAWHGKWCWKYITPLLKKHGHDVIDLDLPGHGDNLVDFKGVDLNTYVNYVENLVIAQKKPVVLVGHSMAGVIISQIAERFPQYIERLVYVAAFVPANDSSLMLEARQSRTPGTSTETIMDGENNTISLNKSEKVRDLFFNCCTEEDAMFAMESLQSEPFKPFIDSIRISDEKFGTVKKTYIECLSDKAITPEDQKRMYSNITCDVISIDADHSPFFSAVEDVAEILLNNKLKEKLTLKK